MKSEVSTPRHGISRRKKFIAEMIKTGNPPASAEKAGYARTGSSQLIRIPEVRKAIDDGISEAARAAGVSRMWVIKKLRDVAIRCMQGEPVLDKLGHETGEWKFDSGGANRAIELIGKHLRMFGEDQASATAQLGTAVIRVLAQQAQAIRLKKQERVPSVPAIGEPLASTGLGTTPALLHSASPPPDVEI